MLSFLKSLRQRLRHELDEHPLATVYYLTAIVGFLTAGLASLRKFTEDTNLIRWLSVGIYFGSVCGILLILKYLSKLKNQPPPLAILNPNAELLEISRQIVVSRYEREGVITQKVKALAPLQNFFLRFRPTGTGQFSIVLESGGKMAGPVHRNDCIFYTITFDKELATDETADFRFKYSLKDEKETMKPFDSFVGANAKKVSNLITRIEFIDSVKSVLVQQMPIGTSSPLKTEDLFPLPNGLYVYTLKELAPGETCAISWVWA